MKSLYFEIDQIRVYTKQARVLDRHHNASMKKWIKKDSFLIAEKKVLWAIGGDIDNPKCGPNDTTGPDYNRFPHLAYGFSTEETYFQFTV